MRLSRFHLKTTKETPADAELASHRLMLRTGMIRKLASGLYTWAPLGLRVLRKVEAVVRQEMDAAGAIELQLPTVQPRELWEESGRWSRFGGQLLQMTDRRDQQYCYAPTAEEVITDFARQELISYRQLPVVFYQIQTKFRDEIRPRYGMIRSRELMMKDAYSFHVDGADLARVYGLMHTAYSRTFDRLGLRYRAVAADSGAIGGERSHEFHVLAEAGEDTLVFSDGSGYAANLEAAVAAAPPPRMPALQRVRLDQVAEDHVPYSIHTVALVSKERWVLAVLRAQDELNLVKLAKLPGLDQVRLASASEVRSKFGAALTDLGPADADPQTQVVADRHAAALSDFSLVWERGRRAASGVNWARDLPEPHIVADIRNVNIGDAAIDGGSLQICRGIEVGHIFQLGTTYTERMEMRIPGEDGEDVVPQMGCYGIGVSRVVAAAIEQNHDERGLLLPRSMAPWEVVICPINPKSDPELTVLSEQIYHRLADAGLDVALDDRGLRTGQMLADMDLIGVPMRIVVASKTKTHGLYELKIRDRTCSEDLELAQILERLDVGR